MPEDFQQTRQAQPLARQVPARRHLPALDGLRAMAVLLVFFLHYGGGAQSGNRFVHLVGVADKAGWSGVTLFFILSGFLITGILWDSRGGEHWWRNFYMRRVLRIFPLYYGVLLLVVITAFFVGHGVQALTHIWVWALFLQDVPVHAASNSVLGSPLEIVHFWSLAVEEQFYLIWPFLILRMRSLRQMRALCLWTMLLSVVARALTWHFSTDPQTWGDSLPVCAGQLAAGAWLAMAWREPALWQRLARLAPAATGVGLLGFIVTATLSGKTSLEDPWVAQLGLPCLTLCFGGLLVLALREGVVARLFSLRWLRWLGGISYGLYVYHVLFYLQFRALALRLAPHGSRNTWLALVFVVAAVVSVPLAWLSYRFVESPILALRKRYQTPPASTAQAPALAAADRNIV